MASIRLTKSLRESIVEGILTHRYGEERSELLELQKQTRDSIMADIRLTSGSVECWDATPRDWFIPVGSMTISNSFEHFWIDMNPSNKIEFNPRVPFFATQVLPGKRFSEETLELIRRADTQADDLKKKEKESKKLAESVVKSVTTVKRLKEIWPDISSIVDKAVLDSGVTNDYLPSVTVRELNEFFNL